MVAKIAGREKPKNLLVIPDGIKIAVPYQTLMAFYRIDISRPTMTVSDIQARTRQLNQELIDNGYGPAPSNQSFERELVCRLIPSAKTAH